MNTVIRRLKLLSLSLTFAGCATSVAYSPADLTGAGDPGHPSRQSLQSQVDITFDTGYTRTLKKGSQWTRTGTLPQGDVYKPYNDVFTVEGANMHEAWLVVAGNRLVGFYLPVEHGFAPLRQTLSITFDKLNKQGQ